MNSNKQSRSTGEEVARHGITIGDGGGFICEKGEGFPFSPYGSASIPHQKRKTMLSICPSPKLLKAGVHQQLEEKCHLAAKLRLNPSFQDWEC